MPPKFDQSSELDQRRNFSVVQGRGVVLPCNVEGDPPPSFAWFKDGSPISLVDVHYFVRQDGSLEIFSADTRDTGQYKCVASNIAGEVEKDMNLFVQGMVDVRRGSYKVSCVIYVGYVCSLMFCHFLAFLFLDLNSNHLSEISLVKINSVTD